MSEKHDAHVLARVADWLAPRTVEEGDCLLWTRSANSERIPCAGVDGRPWVNVRRWVWARTKSAIPAGSVVVPTCRNPRCLSHLSLMTKKQARKFLAESGAWATAAVTAANTRTAQKLRVYTDDQVAECKRLRADGLTLHAIQAKTGVPWRVAGTYCRGLSRRGMAPNASVFAWRGIAA